MRTGQRISNGYTPPTPRPERRVSNPVQHSWITFSETADETRGRRTVIVVELDAGSADSVHCHTRFEERFEVLDGEVVLSVDGRDRTLRRGQVETVKPGVKHALTNRSGRTAHVRVDVTPGHAGFERALRICCGLARDGLLGEDGKPRNPFHMAVVNRLGDRSPGDASGPMMSMLAILAAIGRLLGVERRLIEKYSPA